MAERRGAGWQGLLRARLARACWAVMGIACHDARAGISELQIEQARASLFPNGGGAAYLTIVNRGSGADRLDAAEATWATQVTLHEVVREGDVVGMREVEGGLPIPAGSSLVFQPGGRHFMLEGVSLDADTRLAPLTLHFARAGELATQLTIESSHL